VALIIPELSDKDKERFWIKVDKSNDCWIWKAALSEKSRCLKLLFRHIKSEGYGCFSIKNINYKATRIAWHLTKGSIAEDMVLDHVKGICTTTRCVNPDHLELVSAEENNRRSCKSICKQGHIQSPENRRKYKSKIGSTHYRCKLCKW